MSKLNDSKFYNRKPKAAQKQKASKKQIQDALSQTGAFEAVFDILADMTVKNINALQPGDYVEKQLEAQLGGPMMTVPPADPNRQTEPVEQKVMDLKNIGLDDTQVVDVIKTSDLGNNPDGTANHPVDGEKAPLFTEEIEGTGKIGEEIASIKMAQIVPNDSPEKSEEPAAPEEEKKDVKDLMGPQDIEGKKKIVLDFLNYVGGLQKKWSELYGMLSDAEHPRPFAEGTPKAEKSYLRREIGALQAKLSRAGSMYKRLVKLLGQDMPKNELTQWLQEVQSGAPKMGQAMPPPAPPAPGTPPVPAAPPMGEESLMDTEEEALPDGRSLEEVLEDLSKDVESLTEKVESGETILHGQDVEPVEGDDSGALPAPPSKIAVDGPAKEYYHDLYGDFGDELTRDRVADVVDIVDEMVELHKVALTTEQVANIVRFLTDMSDIPLKTLYARASIVASQHLDFADTIDRILANFMFKSGAINASVEPMHKPALFTVAINSLPEVKAKIFKYVEAAEGKMKQPKKINEQQPDQEKVEKLEDSAKDMDSSELARPAHLPMEVSSHKLSGEYVLMELSWDSSHPAANRSAHGMEQAVKSFMKGMESEKEFLDLGYCGEFNVLELDIDGGFAEVRFKSKRSNDAPLHVVDK